MWCSFQFIQVTPAGGVIKPENYAAVSVHHEEFHTLEECVDGIPQSWWCEDTRDKAVLLVVLVQGCCSTETVRHQIHVRHCLSARTVRIDTKSNSNKQGTSESNASKKNGTSVLRSEVRQPSSSSDKKDL